ncbi:MAG: hypothetical protein Tsb0014_21110 [Pleurocapsa sp.]
MEERTDNSNINDYHILQITDNEVEDRDVSISGNQIVWSSGNYSDSEIFLFDGNQTQQITQDKESDGSPQISGNNIFWHKNTSDHDHLYFYDGTQTVKLSTHDAIYGIRDLNISGSNAVWMAGISAYHGQDIYFFNGSQILKLGADDFDDWNPVISDDGEQVAWRRDDYKRGERAYYGIRLYDGNSTQVITTARTNNYNPIFSGNKLLWFENGLNSYDGNNTTLINDFANSSVGSISGLQASENHLVWYSDESEDGGADYEIYLLSTSENEPIVQLTNNLFDDKNPQTSGNNIVWQGFDGQDYEIFFYDGISIQQITDNDYDDIDPQISGENIAWQGFDGQDYEIYMAIKDDGSDNDFVWRNSDTGQNVIWLMSGTQKLERAELQPVLDPNWDIQATGDFNNDGYKDLIWRNSDTGQNSVWLMDGTTKTSRVSLDSVANSDWDIQGTGDFNNDGHADLVWRNSETGQNSVWLMDGTTKTGRISLDSVANSDWNIQGTGDFNNDGYKDLIWRNSETGQNSVWFMDGTDFISRQSILPVPNSDWTLTI